MGMAVMVLVVLKDSYKNTGNAVKSVEYQYARNFQTMEYGWANYNVMMEMV
jgi:hypothetical protein